MLETLKNFIKKPVAILVLIYLASSFQIYNWLGVNTLWEGGEEVLVPRIYVICSTMMTWLLLTVSGIVKVEVVDKENNS